MSNIQTINSNEVLSVSNNINPKTKNHDALSAAGLHLITTKISPIGNSESAKTIYANLEAAGYEALIDQMINAIKENKDNKAAVASCKKVIAWAISRLKFITPSLDDKYKSIAQKIFSYYKTDGKTDAVQNLINHWSICWTKDIANNINSDLNNWEKSDPSILKNCDRDTLFGILVFSSDANKLHLPNAVQMFKSPSDVANDYAMFILHYLWTTSVPAFSSSNSSQAPIKLDMWDVELIVSGLGYSEDGTPKEKPFINFVLTLGRKFDELKVYEDTKAHFPIWPDDKYPDPYNTIEKKALDDWKQYLNPTS